MFRSCETYMSGIRSMGGGVKSELRTRLTRSIKKLCGSPGLLWKDTYWGPTIVHPIVLLGAVIWKAQAAATNERRAKRQRMVRGIIKKGEDRLVDEDERSFEGRRNSS